MLLRLAAKGTAKVTAAAAAKAVEEAKKAEGPEKEAALAAAAAATARAAAAEAAAAAEVEKKMVKNKQAEMAAKAKAEEAEAARVAAAAEAAAAEAAAAAAAVPKAKAKAAAAAAPKVTSWAAAAAAPPAPSASKPHPHNVKPQTMEFLRGKNLAVQDIYARTSPQRAANANKKKRDRNIITELENRGFIGVGVNTTPTDIVINFVTPPTSSGNDYKGHFSAHFHKEELSEDASAPGAFHIIIQFDEKFKLSIRVQAYVDNEGYLVIDHTNFVMKGPERTRQLMSSTIDDSDKRWFELRSFAIQVMEVLNLPECRLFVGRPAAAAANCGAGGSSCKGRSRRNRRNRRGRKTQKRR